jgi:hypothetical protein
VASTLSRTSRRPARAGRTDRDVAYALAEGVVPEAFPYYAQVLAMLGFEPGTLGEPTGLAEDVADQVMDVRAWLALAHLEAGNLEAAGQVAAMITLAEWEEAVDGGLYLPGGALLTEVFTRLRDRAWCQRLWESLDPYRGRIATIGLVAWGAVDHYSGLVHAAPRRPRRSRARPGERDRHQPTRESTDVDRSQPGRSRDRVARPRPGE